MSAGVATAASGVEPLTLWLTVLALGVATYLLRSTPILLQGRRAMAPFWGRALRYVPAAVMPAMAAPMIAYDSAGAWQSDPARLCAVAVALALGYLTRSILWTIVGGLGAFWLAQGVSALLA